VSIAAIVLAGGRASRLGGAAKPLLEVAGRSLLDAALDAARAAGCAPILAVGPEAETGTDVVWLREEPPFGGPAAALAAALPHVGGAELVLVLASDLPQAGEAVPLLLDALGNEEARGAAAPPDDAATARTIDGAVLVDGAGREQWLTAVYRAGALRAAVDGVETRDAPLRELVGGLRLIRVPDPGGLADDVDTWEDLERARRRARKEPDMADSPRHLPPEALDAWAAALRERFGLEPEQLPISLILDLAGDVARGVARPAAPFSAFVAGLVAGREGSTPAEIEEAVQAVVELARGWEGAEPA